MAKKRKANSFAKQSAAPDSASYMQDTSEGVIPNKKAIACDIESGAKPQTKNKAKQKKKSLANTTWVEEPVEETTFNIDQCRNPLEQEEHWELRRAFLEKNQDVLPPDELVCLAQVFMNVQLLGCRYPPETMKMVEKLAEGIGRDYHRSRACMLKRTFVSASDAAASKVRREGPTFAANVDTTSAGQAGQAAGNAQSNIPPFLLNCLRNDLVILNNDFPQTMKTFNALNNGVKIEANCRPKGQTMYEGVVEASGTTLGRALASDKKKALRMAMENAVQMLSQHCYTIKRKKRATELVGIEVVRKTDAEEQYGDEQDADERDDDEANKLGTGNLGFQLLAKLGWSGGCLGVRGDGIVKPVTVNQRFDRKGLGLNAKAKTKPTNVKLDRAMIQQKLMDLHDGKIEDHHVVFSTEHSKEDRKFIHMLAMKMGLKSQSYGKNTDRQIVVSRKPLRPCELLRKVMLEKNPTFCEMYQVTPPAEQA